MNLQGIVAVSGKPGLWRALAQNKNGYVLESLDAQKTKLIANLINRKIGGIERDNHFWAWKMILNWLTCLSSMKAAASVPNPKDDGKKLREFFFTVAADHDEEKVYSSDIKKIISWFLILKELPLFNEEPATAPVAEETPAAEPVKEEAPAAEAPKAKAKKAPAKKA
jgi:hypothetical protein